LGSITIPFKEIYTSLTGGQASKSSWEYIIMNYRLPKSITAVLVGMGLSISGLLMQTLFRNPLAGPYVLGLSSGASLGVAFVLLGAATIFEHFITITLWSCFSFYHGKFNRFDGSIIGVPKVT
jgi:iron complex transport system permease protein